MVANLIQKSACYHFNTTYSSSWSAGIHLQCCCVCCVDCAAGNRHAVGASASSHQNQLSVAGTARWSLWGRLTSQRMNWTRSDSIMDAALGDIMWPDQCCVGCFAEWFCLFFVYAAVKASEDQTLVSLTFPVCWLKRQHAALTTGWRHNAVSSGHSSLDPDAPVQEKSPTAKTKKKRQLRIQTKQSEQTLVYFKKAIILTWQEGLPTTALEIK